VTIPENETGESDTIAINHHLKVAFVEVCFSATDHNAWTDLEITLTSPDGTQNLLADALALGGEGVVFYDNWCSGSVPHFMESSKRDWTLTVKDLWNWLPDDTGTFQSWSINIYGTSISSIVPVLQLLLLD
jgi:subtilisin-like proprotein convertase family protein